MSVMRAQWKISYSMITSAYTAQQEWSVAMDDAEASLAATLDMMDEHTLIAFHENVVAALEKRKKGPVKASWVRRLPKRTV
jgi:hypothetical protein